MWCFSGWYQMVCACRLLPGALLVMRKTLHLLTTNGVCSHVPHCTTAAVRQPGTAADAASMLAFAAATGGHAAALQLVICIAPEAGVTPNLKGALPLHAASLSCHLEAMRVLLQASPDSASVADSRGFLPLHTAATATARATMADGSSSGSTSNTASWSAIPGDQCAAAFHLLLAAAPHAITAVNDEGEIPLHLAARTARWLKTSAAVEALLAAAPSTAQALNAQGQLPLHAAAGAAHHDTIQLLLTAFPAGAAARSRWGWCPLHYAAQEAGLDGAEAAVRLLLEAAPEVALAPGMQGLLPLELALGHSTIQATAARQAVARTLLLAGPATVVLRALRRAGRERGWPLLPDAIAARAPLTAQEWDAVPFACPGLGRALSPALAAGQGRQLVRRLPRSDLLRLRAFALCLWRVQARRLRAMLPAAIVQHMLCLCLDP